MRKDKSVNNLDQGSKQNRISDGTSIVGDVKSQGDFRKHRKSSHR